MGREHIQRGHDGQRDDSLSGQKGATFHLTTQNGA